MMTLQWDHLMQRTLILQWNYRFSLHAQQNQLVVQLRFIVALQLSPLHFSIELPKAGDPHPQAQ
jgi:hypothetical protein